MSYRQSENQSINCNCFSNEIYNTPKVRIPPLQKQYRTNNLENKILKKINEQQQSNTFNISSIGQKIKKRSLKKVNNHDRTSVDCLKKTQELINEYKNKQIYIGVIPQKSIQQPINYQSNLQHSYYYQKTPNRNVNQIINIPYKNNYKIEYPNIHYQSLPIYNYEPQFNNNFISPQKYYENNRNYYTPVSMNQPIKKYSQVKHPIYSMDSANTNHISKQSSQKQSPQKHSPQTNKNNSYSSKINLLNPKIIIYPRQIESINDSQQNNQDNFSQVLMDLQQINRNYKIDKSQRLFTKGNMITNSHVQTLGTIITNSHVQTLGTFQENK